MLDENESEQGPVIKSGVDKGRIRDVGLARDMADAEEEGRKKAEALQKSAEEAYAITQELAKAKETDPITLIQKALDITKTQLQNDGKVDEVMKLQIFSANLTATLTHWRNLIDQERELRNISAEQAIENLKDQYREFNPDRLVLDPFSISVAGDRVFTGKNWEENKGGNLTYDTRTLLLRNLGGLQPNAKIEDEGVAKIKRGDSQRGFSVVARSYATGVDGVEYVSQIELLKSGVDTYQHHQGWDYLVFSSPQVLNILKARQPVVETKSP